MTQNYQKVVKGLTSKHWYVSFSPFVARFGLGPDFDFKYGGGRETLKQGTIDPHPIRGEKCQHAYSSRENSGAKKHHD